VIYNFNHVFIVQSCIRQNDLLYLFFRLNLAGAKAVGKEALIKVCCFASVFLFQIIVDVNFSHRQIYIRPDKTISVHVVLSYLSPVVQSEKTYYLHAIVNCSNSVWRGDMNFLFCFSSSSLKPSSKGKCCLKAHNHGYSKTLYQFFFYVELLYHLMHFISANVI
jgi:hypothetical protein